MASLKGTVGWGLCALALIGCGAPHATPDAGCDPVVLDAGLVDAGVCTGLRCPNGWSHPFDLTQNGGAIAYDSDRDRTVLFGGYNGTTLHAQTWEWDGTRWEQKFPVHHPPGLYGAVLVYDAAHHTMLHFGGISDWTSDANDETWAWDGDDWHQLLPAHVPEPRFFGTIAFDSDRGRVVMADGYDAHDGFYGDAINDTWEWDGTDWKEVSSFAAPNPGTGFLAYDQTHHQLLKVIEAYPTQTYLWDGSKWSLAFTSDSGADHPGLANGVVYVPWLQRVFFFGGPGDSVSEWDGARWNPSSALSTAPFFLMAGIAVDVTRQQLIVDGATLWWATDAQATFVFDHGSWRAVGATLPEPGASTEMVYDEQRQQTLLITFPFSSSAPMETWSWDGAAWRLLRTSPQVPHRVGSSITYDTKRAQVLMFGGLRDVFEPDALNDLWAWDGVDWTELTPEHRPTARAFSAMGHDRRRGVTVLFGGEHGSDVLDDLWEWRDNDWHVVDPGPYILPARSRGAMAWDSAKNKLLLFGGMGSAFTWLNDTWTYDGTAWDVPFAATTPEARWWPTLIEDPKRGTVYLFGGSCADTQDTIPCESFRWSDTGWIELADAPIAAHVSYRWAFDLAHDQVVGFGADAVGNYSIQDTWLFTPGDAP